MAITFKQARAAVTKDSGLATLDQGVEDASDYSILLAQPQLDDTVTFVSKATGAVHREVYWDQESRLKAMTPVYDRP